MVICITSKGEDMDKAIDRRFGRAVYFIFYNTETEEIKSMKNPYAQSGGGAGTQAAQFVAEQGTRAVLTGNVGPKAFQVLNAAKINVATGVSGTCREAKNAFLAGELTNVSGATVDSHFGMA